MQDDLYDAATALLSVARNLLADTPSGAPARVYVSPGAPARDCELLTVHVAQIGEEVTSPTSPPPQTGHRAQMGRINLPAFVLTVIRCAPTSKARGAAASADDLDASSQVTLRDAWVLWNGLITAVREGELFSTCNEVHWDPAIALPLEGGLGGWTQGVRALLPGYVPDIGT